MFALLGVTNGDQAEATRRAGILRRLFDDTPAFYRQLGEELGFAQSATPAAPATAEWTDPEDPEPDLRDMQGNPAGYSPKALKQVIQNAIAKARHEWQQEFAPVASVVGEFQTEREHLALQQQAQSTAQTVLGELRQDPDFKKHEKDVLKTYQSLVENGYMERYGPVATLHMAWNKFYRESVVPTLGQQTQQQVLSDLQRSAHAGAVGAVAPTPPAPPKPRLREGNVDDLAAHMERLMGAQPATS